MFRPMKPPSGKLEDDQLHLLRFPLACTPKLDGFRASGQQNKLVSAVCKDFPNVLFNSIFCGEAINGLDGELMDGCPTDGESFNRLGSSVGSQNGDISNVKFYVFDCYHPWIGYLDRCLMAKQRIEALPETIKSRVVFVEPVIVHNLKEFLALEDKWSGENGEGYEGMMARRLDSKYKENRSTHTEQGLIRRKKFIDCEAIVTGTYEEMMNCNPEKKNELGLVKRATCKANMKPKGTLGGFYVRVLNGKFKDVQLKIGRFGTEEQAKEMWVDRENLAGKILKFKYQLYGSKDKPRIPIALGFRPEFDVEIVGA